jgi:pyrroloquinoline quinone biosynthesis protein D
MPADSAMRVEQVPKIAHGFRLQFEPTQSAWVLLYPEGMVKLSASAGEILQRIDGQKSIDSVIRDLEGAFPGADLRHDVIEFMNLAHGRGWIIAEQQ